jgi:DNA repair protein RecO (recombination protein O)
VFSRNYGRLAVVAKGAKRPASQLRPILLPLQPLLLSWGGDADIKTLRAAHWCGGHVMPIGDALLTGIYLNELLLSLVPREDPYPQLFSHYTRTIEMLADRALDIGTRAALVRTWELLLLQACGVLPQLDTEGSSLQALMPQSRYTLLEQGGLCEVELQERQALSGKVWHSLQQALDAADPWAAILDVCMPHTGPLQTQLRRLLHYHSGVRTFKTRQVMLDAQSLARHASHTTPASL